MRRLAMLAAAVGLAAAGGVGAQQTPATPEYVPPPGVEMEINLYPEVQFRGRVLTLKKSDPSVNGAFNVESVYVVRGIWEICSDRNYQGRCFRISGSQRSMRNFMVARSVRLVGDTGPLFVESPQPRAGSDVPLAPAGEIRETRPTPAPVVAPKIEEGGAPGTNPSMKGLQAQFYPEPARAGLRVLACPGGQVTPRCAQAAADGFCIQEGYRDSAWRDVVTIGTRAYLADVLCKRAEDDGRGGIRFPSLPNPFR